MLTVPHAPELRHRDLFPAQVPRAAFATQACCNHRSFFLPGSFLMTSLFVNNVCSQTVPIRPYSGHMVLQPNKVVQPLSMSSLLSVGSFSFMGRLCGRLGLASDISRLLGITLLLVDRRLPAKLHGHKCAESGRQRGRA